MPTDRPQDLDRQALPRPRDRAEREKMVAAWIDSRHYTLSGEPVDQRDADYDTRARETALTRIPNEPLSAVTFGMLARAKRRALNILDEWLEVTGAIDKHSSWHSEVEGVVEDAVEIGVQTAYGLNQPLESETWNADDLAVPPVSEASPEGMPELAEDERWGTLDRYGHFVSCIDEAEARSDAAMFDGTHPEDAPHRVVRLAVVEVAREPEPETAPSGWQYSVSDWGTGLVRINRGGWYQTFAVEYVPPIDREHVARLLEAVNGTA